MAARFFQRVPTSRTARAAAGSGTVTGAPRRWLWLEAARPLGASFVAHSATGQPRALLSALIAVEFHGGPAGLSQGGTVGQPTGSCG